MRETMTHKTASPIWQKPPVFFRIIANTVVALPEKIAAAIDRNRTSSALYRLDDYLLKDIGIARSDIERIADERRPLHYRR
jgi:uncharacterized protein YjiS (DUF1127 family)